MDDGNGIDGVRLWNELVGKVFCGESLLIYVE